MSHSIRYLTLLICAASIHAAHAQDSLTIKDAEEIRYKSELLVKREFRDLLNNIANTEIDLTETKKIINNSHSGTRNKIFLSAKVLLEDDINPNFHSVNNTRDLEVEKYLNDFDLLYKKSDAPSVAFTDVKASNVKKRKNIYVKVYYSSFFRNGNKTNDTAYTLNNRVAEIQVTKENGRWVPYIASVSFFNPADTSNDLSDNIPLIRETRAIAAGTPTDSASAVHAQLSFEAEQKDKALKEAIAEDKKETDAYNDLINRGDKALDANDFTAALKYYKEAWDMQTYNPLAQLRINNANKAKERATITADQLYQQYLNKAVTAENKREYQDAITFYNDAIAQKPEKAAQFDAKKRELTEKFRTLSELEEKYKAGLYKDAIKEYSAQIKKNKNNSDLYLGRAKCFEKTNEPKKALEDYDESYRIDNNNLETIQRRAALYKHNGDYFKSLTDYRTYATIYKENTQIYEEMADLLMLINKNSTEAIKHLDEGIAIDPKAPNLYLKKGILLMDNNDYRKADNNFSTVIKLDSNNALAYYLRGKSQLLLNNPITAGVDFEAARQKGLDAQNVKNIEAYGATYYQRAETRFNAGQKDSAIRQSDFAIAIDPQNSTYRFTRGEYYFSLGNYKEALNNYDQAVLLNKDYVDALYKRGLTWYYLGDNKAAIENFNNAMRLNANLYIAEKAAGDAFLALGEYSNASASFEAFLQIAGKAKVQPSSAQYAEAYNGLGKAYYASKNYDKALDAFKNAVKRNPGMAEAIYYRGLTYARMNNQQDAITDMAKAISLENTHYQWHYNLGKAYQDKKDFQNAAVSFNNVIKLDTAGKLPDAVYYRGYDNYQLQNYPVALADYQKVYPALQNERSHALNNEMGNIYLNTNKYDSAYEYYHRTYERDTTDGVALYGLGSALYLKGKADESLIWFEKSFQTKKVNYSDIKKDKLIAALRDDKRFKALIKKYY